MQLYRHTSAPRNPPLAAVPENCIYLSTDKAGEFIKYSLIFSHGPITSNDAEAPGIEIGSPTETFRRVRIESLFGKMTILITGVHLPFPYGRETTGYEVTDLAATLEKAKAAGVCHPRYSLRNRQPHRRYRPVPRRLRC